MASNHITVKDFRGLPGGLTANVWEFPAVKSTNKHGRELSWQVRVWVENAGVAVPIIDAWFDSGLMPAGMKGVIGVRSGVVGGKVRAVDNTYIANGKNIGKVSATNQWTQALRDAFGMYNKQMQKYGANNNVVNNLVVEGNPVAQNNNAVPGVDAGELAAANEAPGEDLADAPQDAQAPPGCTMYPPMLAQVMGEVPDGPAYVQPKLNGVRAMAVLCGQTITMYSRRLKLYPALMHIKNVLKPALWADLQIRGKPVYLDGEIYKHGARLQDISGATRRESADSTEFAFHIYDCFVLGESLVFSERQKVLDDVFRHTGNSLAAVRVETNRVDTVAAARAIFDRYIAAGYEGAMYRLDLPYDFSYNERHSARLLKMKPDFDGEYEIIGWTTGRRGKAADAVMINCKTAAGKEFAVTPAMTLEMRRALARKMSEVEPNGKTHFLNHWLGRPLIVTYDELSKDDVPQRARTKMVIRTWD